MKPQTKPTFPWKEILLVTIAAGLYAAALCFVTPTVMEGLDYRTIWKANFHFLVDAVGHGTIPLWNPYMNLGRPFLADMPDEALYPPAYLVCLGQSTGIFLLVWLHSLLAIAGLRLLARDLQIGRWQSYFMSASFLACGPLMTHWVTGQVTYSWAICYLPILFHFAARAGEPWDWRRIGFHGTLLALQLVCIPQVFWFTGIGQAAFIVARTVTFPLRGGVGRALRGLVQFGAAGAWAAAMLAVALLPFVELIHQSNRSTNAREFVNAFLLTGHEFGYLFSPLFAGVSWESNLFVGTIVVVLGVAGLGLVRERNVRGLLGVILGALLTAPGDQSPFFDLFYKWLPGFASFRIHGRDAMLIDFALICGAGIWLSRPHPRLRRAWDFLFGIPIRWAVIGIVLLQGLDILYAGWSIKRVIPYVALYDLKFPMDDTLQQALPAELGKFGLLEPGRPPPQVCIPTSLLPANSGMIERYSNCDASWALLLRRPWDYLHAALGIAPGDDKGYLSSRVYGFGPFPYRDLNLSAGIDPKTQTLCIATNPSPRAFLVYAAEVTDYDAILRRVTAGHDVHQSALLETAPIESLPQRSSLPAEPAAIRNFELNSLSIDCDAKTNALLVLVEPWYPGWRAEVDGQVRACVPADGWMRAVPVPAGRHQVRFYFHQDYLLPGLLVSLGSFAALIFFARRVPRLAAAPLSSPLENVAITARATLEPPGRAAPFAISQLQFRQLLAVTVVGVLSLWLIAVAAIYRTETFRFRESEIHATIHFSLAKNFAARHETAQAINHYTEALRLRPDFADALSELAWIRAANPSAEFRNGAEAVALATRACELTEYKVPAPILTLAAAYAECGRFDDAVAAVNAARDAALARGESRTAEQCVKLEQFYRSGHPFREAKP